MHTRKFYPAAAVMLAALLTLGTAASSYAEGSAPVVQNLELETFRDVSVGGNLTASDADGGEFTFAVTTQPAKGKVELQADGSFVYTPESGKKGRDYFGFKATDSQGNVSQEGTAIIKISRQKPAVAYSDMSGSGEYYDAVMLAKEGIFTGEKVGASYLFSPERAVTRGEFLTMCMELSDSRPLSGVMSTGFTDDDSIPDWQKPYVSAAVMNGTVCGYPAAGGAVFKADEDISQAEATVMLDKAAGLSSASASSADDLSVPVWAAQSVADLRQHQVIDGASVMSSTLTRAQAAQMLVKALNALKAEK